MGSQVRPVPIIAKPAGWYRKRRFAVLLVILAVLLVGPPLLFNYGLRGALLDLVSSLLLIAAVISLCFEPRQRIFALVLGIPTLVLFLGGHAFTGDARAGVLFASALCEVLFLFGATYLIVLALFTTRPITRDCLYGAVCGYLFLGLGWSVLYALLEGLQPGSFAIHPRLGSGEEPNRPLPHVLTYYSFVTLTTVGYGDVSPATAAARTFAWVEAMIGQFYVAVIVAGLISILTACGVKESAQHDPDVVHSDHPAGLKTPTNSEIV